MTPLNGRSHGVQAVVSRSDACGHTYRAQAASVSPQPQRVRPRPGTIKSCVLSAFEAGRSLTSLDAWRDFGAARLAAVVHDLKDMGWPIATQMIEVDCRGGRTSHVALYALRDGH